MNNKVVLVSKINLAHFIGPSLWKIFNWYYDTEYLTSGD